MFPFAVKEEEPNLCICGYRGRSALCTDHDSEECESCGWNKEVHERRVQQIRENGLRTAKNGTMYLRLRKESIWK